MSRQGRGVWSIVVVGLLLVGIVGLLFALQSGGAAAPLAVSLASLLILLAAAQILWRSLQPSRQARSGTDLAVPLQGLTAAALDLRFGGGRLLVEAGEPPTPDAGPPLLLAGRCQGAVRQSFEAARIALRQPASLFRTQADWRLALAPTVRWTELHLMLGSASADLRLADLDVERLWLETGRTALEATLPARGAVTLHLGGGRVTLRVPPEAAVVIDSAIRLGEVRVDEAHFRPEAGDANVAARWTAGEAAPGGWLSITLQGGLGTVLVEPAAPPVR